MNLSFTLFKPSRIIIKMSSLFVPLTEKSYLCDDDNPQQKMKMHRNLIFLLCTLAVTLWAASATAMPVPAKKQATNAQLAWQVFKHTYDMVFGPQGSSVSYDVNIIGIYKTHGNIAMKGKKVRFLEDRVSAWSDGVTYYRVDAKRKEVEIHKAASDKKDKYSGKYTWRLTDFTYRLEEKGNTYIVYIDAKPGTSSGVRHAAATIDKRSRVPINIRVKVLFFWTTVKLSNFRSGNISDHLFVFPRQKYRTYQFIDKRGEE